LPSSSPKSVNPAPSTPACTATSCPCGAPDSNRSSSSSEKHSRALDLWVGPACFCRGRDLQPTQQPRHTQETAWQGLATGRQHTTRHSGILLLLVPAPHCFFRAWWRSYLSHFAFLGLSPSPQCPCPITHTHTRPHPIHTTHPQESGIGPRHSSHRRPLSSQHAAAAGR